MIDINTSIDNLNKALSNIQPMPNDLILCYKKIFIYIIMKSNTLMVVGILIVAVTILLVYIVPKKQIELTNTIKVF